MQGNLGEEVCLEQCHSCKQVIEEGWKYCPYCKTEISSCSNCGKVIDKNWKFCPHCKTNFNEITNYTNSNEWLASILKDK